MKKVLVIIPTYNEVDNVNQVIEGVEQVNSGLKSYSLDILVVDDNSPDGTAKIVKQLQNKYNNIKLIVGKKSGLGRAYLRGFNYALKQAKYDAFIMMDGDMSHNPKDIPTLLQGIDRGTDYVIGSRYTRDSFIDDNWSIHRKFVSHIANTLAIKLIGIPMDIKDVTGGFKAVKRKALEKVDVNSLNANGYVFQVSLLHAFLAEGLKVEEVPINFSNRSYGKSKLKPRDIIEFVYRVYKLNPNASIQRFIRFCFVGACGSIVNLLVLSLLVKLIKLDAIIAVAIAIEVSIIFNFFLNHYYTFKGFGAYPLKSSKESIINMKHKLVLYNLGALGGAGISLLVFSLLFKLTHINYLIADLISILTAMIWNYWISTRFVWKKIDNL